MKWIDQLPVLPLAVAAVLLALAPFSPEPHLVEKIRMLMGGTLKKPIDIFDLFFHASASVLLLVKLGRILQQKLSSQ